MVARNDITGDAIQSRTASKAYQDNYDLIFRKNKAKQEDIDILENEEIWSQQVIDESNNDK
jgi:hypothetical protein